MAESTKIQLFKSQKIRTAWDEEKEEWYFSIVDVVGVLTDQKSQRGAASAHYPIDSIAQSRAIQAVVRAGRQGTHRGNDRSGTGEIPYISVQK